jgi:hypothetical protein
MVNIYTPAFCTFWSNLKSQPFFPGNLTHHYSDWCSLTSDSVILDIIDGIKLNTADIPPQTYCKQLSLSQEDTAIVLAEIDDLLTRGIIMQVDHVSDEFLSNVFTRKKRDSNKNRVILNLSGLNQYLEYVHFKMDTLNTAIKLITPGCYCASIDLADAYYTVNVSPGSRKFLRFQFHGNLYEFTCLPNGLSPGPRFFTKLMKCPLSYLRRHFGYTLLAYLDDILILGSSPLEVSHAVQDTLDVLLTLGFHINVDKSHIIPTQRIEFLGFLIDTTTLTVSMTSSKADKFVTLCQNFLPKRKISIRQAAQLLGSMSSTLPANPFAKLFSKSLELAKNQALRLACGDFNATMVFPLSVRNDLHWWIANISSSTKDIFPCDPDHVVYCDASTSQGWGAFVPATNQTTNGRWSLQEQQLHINLLELLAVQYTLQALFRNFSDCHIRVYTDNTTTMLCINNQGSTKAPTCNTITRAIWFWAMERNIWLSLAHCPGVLNVEADYQSRQFHDETEWSLHSDCFHHICALYETPHVDIFASRLNRKVSRYYSWHPDPQAEAVDAFTVSWTNSFIYAFPPFSIIPATLQKWRHDRAEGILLVPYWPTQPWFTEVARLLVRSPLLIPVRTGTLSLEHDPSRPHPMEGVLSLLACRCSGSAWRSETYRQQLYRPCWRPGGLPQYGSIPPTGYAGNFIVNSGKLIPIDLRLSRA